MGEYDRIIKENIEAILMVMSKKLLGFEIKDPQPIGEKLQTTIEREPDFLKKVVLEDGSKIILHLEFQTSDDPEMVYRMAEYKAILQRKFQIPVRQYVIYLGNEEPKMRTELLPEEQITGFSLKNIHHLPLDQVIESDVPEEIVFSILADFQLNDAEKVIDQILTKLRKVSTNKAILKKSLNQLVTLARIRKLDVQTKNQIEIMPITYDIETDYLYNEGILKGIEKGIEKGIVQGIEKEKLVVIENMLIKTSLTIDQIAEIAGASIEEVLDIKKSTDKK